MRLVRNIKARALENDRVVLSPMRGKTKVTWVVAGTELEWREADKAAQTKFWNTGDTKAATP